jgi:hypothetical protein
MSYIQFVIFVSPCLHMAGSISVSARRRAGELAVQEVLVEAAGVKAPDEARDHRVLPQEDVL